MAEESMLSWAYAGVNNTLAGNGGAECIAFVPPLQRALETILFTAVGLLEIYVAYPHIRLQATPIVPSTMHRTGRRLLIAFMCLTFGIELGFKFATRQMIWILNPCHIVTIIQIFLLVAQPSYLVTALFRVHMHCVYGATIAVLLPVVNTRLLPFETAIYYIQHILILVIPFYLLRLGGVYSAESLADCSWLCFSLGVIFVYHFVVLQGLGLLTEVNLNNMLCPAVSDPFYGRYYRLYASVHQTLLVSIHGKLYTLIAQFILHRCRPTAVLSVSENNGCVACNGHPKHT